MKAVARYPSTIDNLPITPFLDEAASLLAGPERALVLTAETGAGKSTAMPLALLEHFPGKILMLEPRRIAALAVASRVASLLGEEVGETSGYRMHLETCVSKKTRFEVLTEAILVHMLQTDPSLEGVSVVVLDEFHERSVHTDLALAFLKDAVALRDDLHILVMSATMDAERVASYLGCRTFSVPGRLFPVDVRYRPYADIAETALLQRWNGRDDIAGKAARAVLDELALADMQNSRTSVREADEAYVKGDILVFLPGLSELTRARDYILEALPGIGLMSANSTACVDVQILHSSTPFAEQKRILAGNTGKNIRRVILASSIAETSITVPGVTVVIDSGLSRESRYSQAAGMNRLVTLTESEFSAGQRTGRAGRIAPGKCIRLWSEADTRIKDAPPELMHTDLMPVVLECALWGARDIGALDWLDAPPESTWNSCADLLKTLGCLENDGAITRKGRDALSLGVHPRIACVALADRTGAACSKPDALDFACKYGAQVSRGMNAAAVRREEERLRAALEKRLAAISDARVSKQTNRKSSDNASASSMVQSSDNASSAFVAQSADKASAAFTACGALCLLAGFPDRLAHHAGGGVYQFPSGRKAFLPREYLAKTNDAALPEWIIAPDADAGEREGRIYRWETVAEHAPKADDALSVWLAAHQNVRVEAEFVGAAGAQKLKKTEYTCFGEIILKERRLEATASDSASAWETLVRKDGIRALPWSDACDAFLLRWEFRVRHLQGAVKADKTLDLTASALANALPADTACKERSASSARAAGAHASKAGDALSAKYAGAHALSVNNDCGARTDLSADDAVSATAVNYADACLKELAGHPEKWLTAFIPRDGRLTAETVLQALRYALDGEGVDRDVPLRLKLENGRERRLTYEVLEKAEGPVPVLEVIIQQMFGCTETPRVMGEPVLLRLLSPARRPLQITKDLGGFWKNTWPEVCKEMKGRYPKHNWDHTRFVDE